MKPLFTIIMALIVAAVFAQEEMLPKKGNKGMGLLMPGITGGADAFKDAFSNPQLIFRYFLADNTALRCGLGINSVSTKAERRDSIPIGGPTYTGVADTEKTLKQFNFSIGLGIEKHMGSGKLDPYMGAALSLASLGKTKTTAKVQTEISAGMTTVKTDMEMDGGFGLGINLIGGFNYFFSRHIAVGAEVMWGFNSETKGGGWKSTTTITPPSGTSTTKTDIGKDKSKSSGVNVGATAGINLSWFW